MSKSFAKLCPDFELWPRRWMGSPEDVPFGEKIVDIFRAFIEDLIESKYAEKTIRKHIDNLWLLGGEIVRKINFDPDLRNSNPLALLMESIGPDGGPYCRHLDTEAEMDSFDATCRKLFKFLKRRGGSTRGSETGG
jgi:hypothetical protein